MKTIQFRVDSQKKLHNSSVSDEWAMGYPLWAFNTLRPRQNGRLFHTTFSNAFSWMKMKEFSIKISQKFVPKDQINNIPSLVQIMAWRRPGDKSLSEAMLVSLLTHIRGEHLRGNWPCCYENGLYYLNLPPCWDHHITENNQDQVWCSPWHGLVVMKLYVDMKIKTGFRCASLNRWVSASLQ